MNRTLRACTLGLMLGTAGVVATQMVLPAPAMAQSATAAPSADLSVGWYKKMAGEMDRRTIRDHMRFLKANRSSLDKKETRAKLDILKAALRSEKSDSKAEQAQKRKDPGTQKQAEGESQEQAARKKQSNTQQSSGSSSQTTQNTADDSLAKVEKAARQFLSDAGTSSDLSRAQLRDRISKIEEMLAWKGIEDRTRNRLERLRSADQTALKAASQTQQTSSGSQTGSPSSETERTAEGILSDNRSASSLDDQQLRQRVERSRDLLRQGRLGDRYNNRMRDQLRTDRQELRRRMRDRRDGNDNNTDWSAYDRRLVAGDVRHADSLTPREINNRISRTRGLLDRRDLTNRERDRLLALLEDDRRELRQRYRNRRDHRRGELDRWLRGNQINIVIAPPSAYEPRDDIAFAEVDDMMIERQLIAPPRRRIDRRYSFQEFRQQPELRTAMPAIDVDSIRFGFDEAFVRAEEIDELERLGAIIEKIVAKNPDEVFVIEGHTDAVGSPEYNLELSQRRAEAVRSALLEYFVIEPENLETVGYGEQYLKIPTPEEEQENRRVTIRRITPLIAER